MGRAHLPGLYRAARSQGCSGTASGDITVHASEIHVRTTEHTRWPRFGITAARRRRAPNPGVNLATVALALATLLAACGGSATSSNGVVTLASPSSEPGATPSATPADPRDAMLAYAECMRDNGIDMPDPQFSSQGGGVKSEGRVANPNQPGYQAAEAACRKYLDAMLPQSGGREVPPEMQDALLNFARCMRENGINVPDPVFRSGGWDVSDNGGGGQTVDPESPTYKAAAKACNHFIADLERFGSGDGPASGGPSATPSGGGQP